MKINNNDHNWLIRMKNYFKIFVFIASISASLSAMDGDPIKQANLDAIQFSKEQESKRNSAAKTKSRIPKTQVTDSVDVIADAFHGLKGNSLSKEVVRARLPFPVQKYIAKLSLGQMRRAEIRDLTRFVHNHLQALLPGVSPYYCYFQEGKKYCDEVYAAYKKDPNKIQYDHPIILCANDISYSFQAFPGLTNTTCRDITRLSEILGKSLKPTQVMLVQYSDGRNCIMIAEQDRQKLLNFSQEQRDFIIEMRKRKYERALAGRVYPHKKLTHKERAILESFDRDTYEKLIYRYGLNNEIPCIPNSVLRASVRSAEFMLDHIPLGYIIALIFIGTCYKYLQNFHNPAL